jgi:hypothetical protein
MPKRLLHYHNSKSMFRETSNKFRKGSPVQLYAAQAGEEWHWRGGESKYVLCQVNEISQNTKHKK